MRKKQQFKFKILNVGSEQPTNIYKIVNKIADIFNFEKKLIKFNDSKEFDYSVSDSTNLKKYLNFYYSYKLNRNNLIKIFQ